MNEVARPRPAEFDAVGIAKELLRTIRAGALATLDRDGGSPFASLVTVATDIDGTPLLLMSRLSGHTQNLEQDPRASILLAQRGKGDPLAHPRLTVIGRAERTRTSASASASSPAIRRRSSTPTSAISPSGGWSDAGHLNGGFGRAKDLTADEIRTELAGRRSLSRPRRARSRT